MGFGMAGYIEITECPHCGENIYLTIPDEQLGNPDVGRYCPHCGRWISGKDIKEYLTER